MIDVVSGRNDNSFSSSTAPPHLLTFQTAIQNRPLDRLPEQRRSRCLFLPPITTLRFTYAFFWYRMSPLVLRTRLRHCFVHSSALPMQAAGDGMLIRRYRYRVHLSGNSVGWRFSTIEGRTAKAAPMIVIVPFRISLLSCNLLLCSSCPSSYLFYLPFENCCRALKCDWRPIPYSMHAS